MALKSDIIDSHIFSGKAASEEQALNDLLWRYYVEGEENETIEGILDSLRSYDEKYQPPPSPDDIENALGLFPRTRDLSLHLPDNLIQPEHVRDIPGLHPAIQNQTDAFKSFLAGSGLKPDEFANATGFSPRTIYNWMSGRPITTHYALYKLLNVFWPKSLSDIDKDNIKRFIVSVNPGITQGTDEARLNKWPDKKIEQKNWMDISFPAFCPYWLAQQPMEDPETGGMDAKKNRQIRAGLLLRACRKYKEEQSTPTSSSRSVNTVKYTTRTRWETGVHPIDPTKLGSLIAEDKPFPECIYHLALLAIPELNTFQGKKWLRKEIHIPENDWNRWNHDVFSPGNSAFFDVLPKKKRAGWILRKLRQDANKSLAELADILGISEGQVSDLELGENSIDYSKLVLTIMALRPSRENIIALTTQVIAELDTDAGKAWLNEQISDIGENWERWNQDVFSFTHDQFRSFFPEELQGGYYLRELRERAGIKTQKALADKLGAAQNTVSHWEIGESTFSIDSYKTPLITALKLFDGPEEEKPAGQFSYAELEKLVETSNRAILKRNALRHVINNIAGNSISERAALYSGTEPDTLLEEQSEIIAEIILHRLDINERLHPLIVENGIRQVVQIIADRLEYSAFGKKKPEEYDRNEIMEEAMGQIYMSYMNDIAGNIEILARNIEILKSRPLEERRKLLVIVIDNLIAQSGMSLVKTDMRRSIQGWKKGEHFPGKSSCGQLMARLGIAPEDIRYQYVMEVWAISQIAQAKKVKAASEPDTTEPGVEAEPGLPKHRVWVNTIRLRSYPPDEQSRK